MAHEIDKDTKNSNIEYCINEYVRNERDREILRKRWFRVTTIEGLASEYQLSETKIKEIIYDMGDEILLRAADMP